VSEGLKRKFWEVGRYGCQKDGLDELDSMGREGGRARREGGREAGQGGREGGRGRTYCFQMCFHREEESSRGAVKEEEGGSRGRMERHIARE
jgi:hypothetical protein